VAKKKKPAEVYEDILGTQIAMMAAHGGYSLKIFDPLEGAF
jgi:hypothetical protein